MRDNAIASGRLGESDPERPDTFLCVLPLFHSFGQSSVQNCAMAFGGTMVMLERFDGPKALELIRSESVTVFHGVPTIYWELLRALDADDSSEPITLRVACSGGAAMPEEIHRQVRERLGVTVLEGYGLSETSPTASFNPYGQEPRIASVGLPIPGVEMKLIDDEWNELPDGDDVVGEIAIRGHNVMKGYYGRPAATAEAIRDGWFRTGDLARRDADGYYYIVDRRKDMIIRGGFNVYPRELEEVLMTHPAVSLVAVVGIPHPSHGEEIKAFVCKNPGFEELSEEELVAWGKEQFAAYKYPRIVEFVSQMPLTSTGKILKRELVARERAGG